MFPTLYIKYRCNDDNTLSLSVTSRINRPNYVDLNPFTTYVDAHTIQTGNPNLQPMKSYMAELGFTHKAFSISASAKRITSVMSTYTDIDEVGKMTRHTVDNVMDKSVYNLNLSYYFDCLKWLDSYLDGSVYMVSSEPLMPHCQQLLHGRPMSHSIDSHNTRTVVCLLNACLDKY